MRKRTLGLTFFETHPQMEKAVLDPRYYKDHVIVDKEDYDAVIAYLVRHKISANMIMDDHDMPSPPLPYTPPL